MKGRYRMAPVAIKKLRDQSPEQQAAFLREMAILRACHGNRHIVPFVGASIAPVGLPSPEQAAAAAGSTCSTCAACYCNDGRTQCMCADRRGKTSCRLS